MKKIRLSVTERLVRNSKGIWAQKYITRLTTAGRVTEEKFIEEVAKQSGLTEARTLAVIKAMGDITMKHLTQNDIVVVPYLGYFRLGLRTTAKTRRGDAGAKAINSALVNFLIHPKQKDLFEIKNMAFHVIEKTETT